MSTAAGTGSDDVDWGGFRHGDMALALPMSALREVAPCRELTPLPVAVPGIAGGLVLRGFTLPVLDLAAALGWPASGAPLTCAVVVYHDGRLLAVRADSVTGVFRAEPGSVTRATVPAGPAAPFGGSIRRADTGELVTLLSVDALAALPGVPWITDPEPRRQAMLDDDPAGDMAPPALTSLLLLQAGARSLAIDAAFVHSTLSNPVVEPSPITSPLTPGVVRAYGKVLPAVDLAALCGLGALPAAQQRQAVVVAHARGLVVLLVERVMEIVQITGTELFPAPPFALAHPELLTTLFPGTAVPVTQQVADEIRARQYLVIDGAALLAMPAVVNLAATNVPDTTTTGAVHGVAGPTGAAAVEGRSVITFMAPREMAVPIEQVSEILPEAARCAPLDPDALVTRIVVERDRTIPVVRLERLLGTEPGSDGPPPVLVVSAADTWLGFEVTRLHSIEHATWEYTMRGKDDGAAAGPTLVTVGQGASKRTIPLLDLVQVAGTFIAGERRQAA